MSLQRTALLGAETLAGRALVERLRDEGLPPGELVLAEPGGEHGVLAAVGGELVVSTPRVRESLEGAGLVLCCAPVSGDDLAAVREAARKAVVLDLVGSLEAPPVDALGAPPLAAGVHASPAGASLLVAALARSARKAGATLPMSAVVLEPASELGQEAVEELHRQVLAVVTFAAVPMDVLGRQVALDVGSPPVGGSAREARIAREVRGLAGDGAVTLLVVQAGTFHGVAVAARADVGAAAWRKAMAGEPRLTVEEDEVASPFGAVRGENAVVGRIVDDGQGGAWAWAAADTLAQGAVGNAVLATRALAGAEEGASRRRRKT